MRTDDLINALAADAPVTRPQLKALAPLLSGIAVMVVGYALMNAARADLVAAAGDPAFLLKLIAAALLAVAAAGALRRLAAPGQKVGRWRYALLAPTALVAGGILVALGTTPSSEWWTRLVGTNAVACLTLIPAFAAAPLAGALLCLRGLAPTRPAAAGAVAGLLAGGLGAVLYGTTCIDDSPLFVATWYSLAITLVAGAGAVAGQRFLRW